MAKSTLYAEPFTNEFGNKVTLTLEADRGDDGGPTLVTICMMGPKSTSENTITLAEARKLKAALNATIR